MTQTLRDILRERTREAHGRVDALYGRLMLAEREGLSRFLTAHYLALAPVEAAIRARANHDDIPPALAPLVRRDLDALGAPVPGAPHFGTLEHADPDGLSYVVAGSHLGARVLRRQWARSEDGAVRGAGQYLSSDAMAAFWPGFVQGLNARQPNRDVVERVVGGAVAAFSVFERAFALSADVGSRAVAS